MKRILIACMVLAAVALFVEPALAVAPSPQYTVTWRGSGVSDDNPSLIDELVGDQVKFAGVATQDAFGLWSGRGTIVDRARNLKADLVVLDGTFLSEDQTQVYLMGDATVRADGVTYSNEPFGLTLDRSTSEFQLYIEQNVEYVWLWWVPGSSFKGSIRST